ncbi:hypothetical protein Acy02nite_06010 [Actinoplanes cyaneus]|uniref:Uncharacterized protein n=1 Tax=Actinoplanes cyaneus TaxID=52696 RepID=A0A919LY81_9ACTN|nr:hypothetical protein [Actinoplanes cyaneus]MCW2135915.1 hypothetical protein [Actinoplanes cyaneus]GID62720.1 hypothetical protein Acy02nite_06010 [Actinoplanes cyaneus]
MTTHPGQPDPEQIRQLRRPDRRRERIRRQVHQARHGRQIVPTWLMAAILGLILAGWLYLIITK